MLFAHGLPKLMGFSEKAAMFPDPIGLGSQVSLGLAIFAEVFCAAAVVLGLWTRFTVIPLLVTMAIAFFNIHALDPFAKKEKAFLYLIGFLILVATDTGKYGLDHIKLTVKKR